MKPFVVHSVLWNRFAGTSTDSKDVLLGTRDGRVYRSRFGKGLSSRYDAKDKYSNSRLKEIARVEGIVCGLQLARLLRNDKTYVLLVATTICKPDISSVRLAQFVGGHSSLLEGKIMLRCLSTIVVTTSRVVDLPTPPINVMKSFRCSLGFYPDDTRGGVWALTTGMGALCG